MIETFGEVINQS